MSYILEALKKSEYARHQGKVPDLTTVPVAAVPSHPGPPRLRFASAMAAVALAVLVAVLLVWRPWQSPQAETLTASPVPPHASPRQPVQEASVSESIPATGAERSASPVPDAPQHSDPASATLAPRASTAPVRAQSPPISQALMLSEAVRAPAQAPAAPSPQAVPVTSIAPVRPEIPPGTAVPARPAPVRADAPAEAPATAPAPPARPPSPPDRILAFYELPESIRAALPALAVSGFSYTDEPRARMAVINDRILREGEHAGGGVMLERIASDGIVLRYQDFRFRP